MGAAAWPRPRCPVGSRVGQLTGDSAAESSLALRTESRTMGNSLLRAQNQAQSVGGKKKYKPCEGLLNTRGQGCSPGLQECPDCAHVCAKLNACTPVRLHACMHTNLQADILAPSCAWMLAQLGGCMQRCARVLAQSCVHMPRVHMPDQLHACPLAQLQATPGWLQNRCAQPSLHGCIPAPLCNGCLHTWVLEQLHAHALTALRACTLVYFNSQFPR